MSTGSEGVIPPEKGIELSHLEGTAYFLGILSFCSIVESNVLDGDWPKGDWEQLRLGFLAVLEKLGFDEYLKGLDPNEPLFMQSTRERAASDTRCFFTTHRRLDEIRRLRGVNISRVGATRGLVSEGKGAVAHYSGLENFSRLSGMLDVLAGCEWLTGTGAVPSDTFREIVTKAIGAEEIKSLLVFVEQMDLGDRLLPGIKDGISAEAGVDALLVERGKGVPVFLNLMNAFIRKKEEIIQKTWEVWFVEDFLKKYTFSEPRNQAREILFTLQRRLRARREAVERFEYHRLETIDENCKQLLTTLEQYGIKATTYDQALREFERRYGGPKEPPKSLVEKTHQDVEERIGDLVRLQEARDTALRANPEWGEFIRWEYQKAIDQLSERRR